MTISAKVVADSISAEGIRLTTFELRYPRFIHAEFMTHRKFSRNASSSRAIPVERLIADIERDPAMPVWWGKHQPGMQAREAMSSYDAGWAESIWHKACIEAVANAHTLRAMGAHKQIVNRILEPFSHINVVCTATDYENFFALRRHEDAQPEIKVLADAMWEAREASIPQKLNPGEWHLPYVSYDEWSEACEGPASFSEIIAKFQKVSVARCARVSYLTHDGKIPSIEEDLKLYDRLVGSIPLHASPAEHQATPDVFEFVDIQTRDGHQNLVTIGEGWANPHEHGNLTGFRQYRKMLPNEFLRG